MQMEQNKWKKTEFDESVIAPVFICGLARSGSTLLLNRLTATSAFSTSTYRHMPFVLAPNMWSGASKAHRKASSATERAHGDGMLHSFDSEEAFEEVFWRAVTPSSAGSETIAWNKKASADDLAQFRLFMTSVVKSGAAPRYLSKNNNNTTRIPTLLKSAETARVVVPFRNPVDFAGSTLSQHHKFLETHKKNPFDAQYMAWLGHTEFGPNFKPFAAPGVSAPEEVTTDFLLRYWSAVYRELLTIESERVQFFDYDAFCEEPAARLEALGAFLGLDPAPEPPDHVHKPHAYESVEIAESTRAEAEPVYQALKKRALK